MTDDEEVEASLEGLAMTVKRRMLTEEELLNGLAVLGMPDDLRELASMVPEGWSELCDKAADEIERLRKALSRLIEDYEDETGSPAMAARQVLSATVDKESTK